MKIEKENISIAKYLNDQLEQNGNYYQGSLIGGSGNGEIYLTPQETRVNKSPDLIRVQYKDGEPVKIVRVDLYTPKEDTPPLSLAGHVESKFKSGQAEEVVVRADGRNDQQLEDMLNQPMVYPDGEQAQVQQIGSEPVFLVTRAPQVENQPPGDMDNGSGGGECACGDPEVPGLGGAGDDDPTDIFGDI